MENWDLQNPYLMIISSQKYRHRFSKEEDDKLLILVNNFENKDLINWNRVASKMQDRTPRQCRERYLNYLMEKNKKGDWSKEEDELILSLYNQIGPKWAKMTSYFNKRSNIDIKNRYSTLIRRKKKKSNQEPSIISMVYQQTTNIEQFLNSFNFITQNQNIKNINNNDFLHNDCHLIKMADSIFFKNTFPNQDMIHFV